MTPHGPHATLWDSSNAYIDCQLSDPTKSNRPPKIYVFPHPSPLCPPKGCYTRERVLHKESDFQMAVTQKLLDSPRAAATLWDSSNAYLGCQLSNPTKSNRPPKIYSSVVSLTFWLHTQKGVTQGVTWPVTVLLVAFANMLPPDMGHGYLASRPYYKTCASVKALSAILTEKPRFAT